MKKIILLAFTALMMVGCLSKRDSNGTSYDVHVIDSCEYIDGGHLYGIGHKGNCQFCEERDSIKWEKRKKELEELVIRSKTTLEITHKDGGATDTIVIFKDKEK